MIFPDWNKDKDLLQFLKFLKVENYYAELRK